MHHRPRRMRARPERILSVGRQTCGESRVMSPNAGASEFMLVMAGDVT